MALFGARDLKAKGRRGGEETVLFKGLKCEQCLMKTGRESLDESGANEERM